MASFNGPKLTNPIRTDVPDTNEILVALAKQDPTSISDIPVGAKRLYEASSGKWQWQEYNGSSWAAVPFLQHNVDQLDGYHAAITPAANTVAVRNASGLLQDSITGNAATASSAATLSQTLPVNKGGTGATTSEAARANLGVPPTSHASTSTTHGVGNATQYGHLKLSDATNSSSGATGGVAATPAAVKAAKDAADAAQSSADNAQSSADAAMTKASTLATASAAGIVKPGTGMTVDAAGALNVNASTASTPGLVKSSETAQAGTVPVGGADGSLGEDWLKKAMEAAAEAKDAADKAQSDATSALSPAKKLGTRAGNTDSQWTLTNLTPGRLLVILVDSTKIDDTETFIIFVSGTVTSNSGRTIDYSYATRIGKPSGGIPFSPYSTVDIITNQTVVIKLFTGRANSRVSAYEV